MQTRLHDQPRDRSLGELLGDLTRQVTTLIRKEMEMARLETGRKISDMIKEALLVMVGVAMLAAGFLALLATAVIVLSLWLSLWLAALMVTIAVLAAGGIVVSVGRRRLREKDIKPTQAIITLKENKRWIEKRI